MTNNKLLLISHETEMLIIMNLLRNTAYQVQIRHRSIKAENPLWSNWSPVLIVPAGKLMYLAAFF